MMTNTSITVKQDSLDGDLFLGILYQEKIVISATFDMPFDINWITGLLFNSELQELRTEGKTIISVDCSTYRKMFVDFVYAMNETQGD